MRDTTFAKDIKELLRKLDVGSYGPNDLAKLKSLVKQLRLLKEAQDLVKHFEGKNPK